MIGYTIKNCMKLQNSHYYYYYYIQRIQGQAQVKHQYQQQSPQVATTSLPSHALPSSFNLQCTSNFLVNVCLPHGVALTCDRSRCVVMQWALLVALYVVAEF